MASRKKKAGKAQPKRQPVAPNPSRLQSRLPLIAGIIAIAIITVAAAVGTLALTSGSGQAKTAAIVDQLSLTQPNQDFLEKATGTLTAAGYKVDYFPGEQVTVDLYRQLPQRHYDIILMRVHAGITEEIDVSSGSNTPTEYVSLFTGELYSDDKYPASEQVGYLGKATYDNNPDSPALFAISPRFIQDSMLGDFDGALVIMMGCDGLKSQKTGQAFLDKGASAFVSWSNKISAPHTDDATERLLQHVLVDKQDIQKAVTQTASEVGRDPTYGGELRILPTPG